jgi:DNA uptake protein ComE-like DNA-binding protein
MFFLLAIILVLQLGYFYLKIYPVPVESSFFPDKDAQNKIESIRAVRDSLTLFPFNPNFISDHKGYVLGMSVVEIDRLHAYRAEGKYVNTISDFQQVTQISDSLLMGISPFFKFLEWINEKGTTSPTAKIKQGVVSNSVKIISVRDLNAVTAEELKIVRGIGDKLSVRIMKFRDRLGGFLQEGQLYHVYGLEREVAARVLVRFKLLSKPQITKIIVNSASSDELSQLIYIPYTLSKAIVTYRESNGGISSFEELTEIQDFPADKIDIIKLYLSL